MSPKPESRRDFLIFTGQLGAVSLIGPSLAQRLLASPRPDDIDEYLIPPPATPVDASPYSGLRWRMLGPFRGGRVDAVTGVPGRPNEFYFGAVNGGVWKIDRCRAGVASGVRLRSRSRRSARWRSRRQHPTWSTSGTGESTLRDSMGFGNGVYKSTDAGATWTHLGLDETHHIGRIAVDPRNPNVVFVAAIGHLYAASPERGVFRTRDGGKTWQKVLYQDENVGAVDVVDRPDPTRKSSTPVSGTRGGRRGTPTSRRTAPAAASGSRPTAAPPGSS